MLDGYATKTIIEPINAPWWDNLVTEFFTENLIPYTFRDERDYLFPLEPATVPDKSDLVAQAGEPFAPEERSFPRRGASGPPTISGAGCRLRRQRLAPGIRCGPATTSGTTSGSIPTTERLDRARSSS